LTSSGELMSVGTETGISLPPLSVPVDGQWQTGLYSVHQGRKITPSHQIS